jgi:hypothetical protein
MEVTLDKNKKIMAHLRCDGFCEITVNDVKYVFTTHLCGNDILVEYNNKSETIKTLDDFEFKKE